MTGLTSRPARGAGYERYAPIEQRALGSELAYRHRRPSPLSDQLRALLEHVEAHDWQTRDELQRVWADFESGVRVRLALDHGERERDRWDRHGPGVTIGRYGMWESPDRAGWLDHPYRLIREGVTTYVSEPYQLTTRGVRALAALAEQGWGIWIAAKDARHFPGETLAVYLTRKPDRGPRVDWFES